MVSLPKMARNGRLTLLSVQLDLLGILHSIRTLIIDAGVANGERAKRYRQHFPVIGKNGINLQEQWDNDIPESYVGLAPENMPNFYVFLGPNGGPGVGSTVPFLENGARYMIACIQKLQREWYKSMTPKFVLHPMSFRAVLTV
jgi:cation diffusion facilitator CzcD-associated flavoprotein CzcO